jgi:hypothetical protein
LRWIALRSPIDTVRGITVATSRPALAVRRAQELDVSRRPGSPGTRAQPQRPGR